MSIKNFVKTNLVAIAALGIGIATMSFKTINERKAATVYYYISNSTAEGQFHQTANWSVSNNSESCQNSGARPCKITVPTGSTLSSELGNRTNEDILSSVSDFKQ